MKTSYTFMFAAALGATACGRKDDGYADSTKTSAATGTTPNAASDDTTQLAGDEELAGDAISAQVDEAIAGAAEDQTESATGAGLSLTETDTSKKVDRYRKCTEQDAKAVVEIKRAAERSWTFEGAVRQGSSELKHLVEITRTWSREGGDVACAANGKHAALVRADMKGMKLEATFKRQRSRSASFTNSKRGVKVSRSAKFSAAGNRSVTWSDVTVANGTVTLAKTISQQATRTLEITNKKGETKSFEQTVATDASAPLEVVTVRDEATDAVKSRTIVSGKKIATGKDGGRVETSFDNVKYEAGKGCYAVSGKITGAIYAKDGSEAKLTFTIDFATDGNTISFSDGNSVDYVADGCELDIEAVEQATDVTEKDSAAEVTEQM